MIHEHSGNDAAGYDDYERVDSQLAEAALLLGHVSIKGVAVWSDTVYIGRHQDTEGLLDNMVLTPAEGRANRSWDVTVPASEDEPALNAILSAKYARPEGFEFVVPTYSAIITGNDEHAIRPDRNAKDARPADAHDLSRIAATVLEAQALLKDQIVADITEEERFPKRRLSRFLKRKSA